MTLTNKPEAAGIIQLQASSLVVNQLVWRKLGGGGAMEMSDMNVLLRACRSILLISML